MKLAHLGWVIAIIGWAISISLQVQQVDMNTELRHQIQLITLERDLTRNDLAACRGDMRP